MKKIILILTVLSILFLFSSCNAEAQARDISFSVDILNTGKSDAILITSGNSSMLIDTGEKDDYGAIEKALQKRGVTRLDMLILTHFDKDHIGSAHKVIKYAEIGEIIAPRYECSSSAYEKMQDVICQKNMSVNYLMTQKGITERKLGDAEVTIYPPNNYSYSDDNDYSLIISVKIAGKSLLFMGDALKDRVDEFQRYAESEYYFVKLPHHGSMNKSLRAFLNSHTPENTAMTVEKQSDADASTVALLNALQVKSFYSSNGNIEIIYKNGEMSIGYSN